MGGTKSAPCFLISLGEALSFVLQVEPLYLRVLQQSRDKSVLEASCSCLRVERKSSLEAICMRGTKQITVTK